MGWTTSSSAVLMGAVQPDGLGVKATRAISPQPDQTPRLARPQPDWLPLCRGRSVYLQFPVSFTGADAFHRIAARPGEGVAASLTRNSRGRASGRRAAPCRD